MRRLLQAWIGLFCLVVWIAQADTVLLTDDFEDASIDSSKWTLITGTGHTSFDDSSAGGTVTETAGYLFIQNAAGAYKSKLLPVDGKGEIVVTRSIYISRGSGSLVSRPDEIVAEDGTVLLRWGYHDYNDGNTVRDGFGGFDDPSLVAVTWDTTWVNEIITYDPVTGQGSYSNAKGTATVTGIPLPSGTTNLYLRGSAYAEGSSTDYKAINDFTVTQTDRKLLTVSSAYGSPVPGIGNSAYDVGTVVTCSVESVTADGEKCLGWTGTGSVPASGTTNEVVFTLSEDSSITWHWNVLLDDDFEDGTLDASKWTAIKTTSYTEFNESLAGLTVSETNGAMRLYSSAIDNGGAYRSANLSVDDQGQIVLERRTQVHAKYAMAYMTENLMSESGETLLTWGYYNYDAFGVSRFGFGGFNDARATGVWDEWFDEVITYDPSTGYGTYSLNGSDPVLVSGAAMSAGTSNVYLRGGASGAYYGHTKQFDSFKVLQDDPVSLFLLSVASEQGTPDPAVGSFVHEQDASLTLSVGHQMTNNGTLYQCTGWTGTGSVPSSGTTNTVDVVITQESSITWNWEIIGQWLDITEIGNGSVNLSSGFYAPDSEQTLIATPDAGSWFAGWGGDATGTENVTLTMDAPKTVAATFRNDVLLDDDFNDESLDTSAWTAIKASSGGFSTNSAGSSLTESGGTLNISYDVLNDGGAYMTRLPVSDRGIITIERRTKVSASGAPTMLEVLSTESGDTLLYWMYTSAGFGYGASLAPAVWGEWFDETITYDPMTGEGTYSINGGTPVSIATADEMPANTTHVLLKGGSAGDTTGGTKQFDSFTVSQGTDSSRAALTIGSALGTPSPAAGYEVYDSGTIITCTVDSAYFDGQTHYICSGWSGSGSVPASGTTNEVLVTLEEDSTLGWTWAEVDHYLELTVDGGGAINLSSDFYAADSVQTLVATPAAGWEFIGWDGDAIGIGDAVVTMSEPKSITARFVSLLPTITNMTVAQVEGTRTVAISFETPADESLMAMVEVFHNGTNLNADAFSGAGMVQGGTNQTIVWDAGADWNLNVDELTFRLLLDNGLPSYTPYEGGIVNIPQTGQTQGMYDEEDGNVRPGLTWPSPRFTDNGDETITDNLTGLMWAKSASSAYWHTALQNCDGLTLAGHDDWRLPNVREMRSLCNYGLHDPAIESSVFSSLPYNDWYWTSTTLPNYSFKYAVSLAAGTTYAHLTYNYGTYYSNYYLPVRTAMKGLADVPRTGQTQGTTYAGEDGDLQAGAAWPSPRFTDHGDGTVTDHLTGLMWSRQSSGGTVMRGFALQTAENSALAGYDDWRIPSVNELESLYNYDTTAYMPAGHPFVGMQTSSSARYWTSTLYSKDSNYGFAVSFYDGEVELAQSAYYLTCRGGVATLESVPSAAAAQVALAQSGQTNSYVSGDDGASRIGVESTAPRFTGGGDFVYDELTGFTWWAVGLGPMQWSDAATAANQNNWRLPNVREVLSLIDYGQSGTALPEGHPFTGIQSSAKLWTSTSAGGFTGGSTGWQVDLESGKTLEASKTEYAYYLVVSTNVYESAPLQVAVTGQTNSYHMADDGAVQSGAQETGARFSDNGNGTVNDNRTGLMWLGSMRACGAMTWAEAVAYCENLNFCGYADWRLPNVREMESLVDYSQRGDQTVLPQSHPFSNATISGSSYFWTSTTYHPDSGRALAISFYNGAIQDGSKTSTVNVWPVRGGE
ncbi:Lcl domain-containing protein [Tichowtungia aerotolerans]|uniref:DUF1566 domain-containing protein n=1 Tax=Tichowtungia aerotolerans TaxID=2697043 RepID=A0A6P1M0N0_9BACT|nr:DUF1566 domain-containing protein [Tichowtungia aerotolerans]QHI68110.1 DUF1566 domain-containing protein [Tichowtungia aerotolerans]